MPGSDSEDDHGDAEFTDVDEDGTPYRPTLLKVEPKPNRPWGSILLLICLIAGGIYWLRPRSINKAELPVMAAGWEELGPCEPLTSLDGMKEIHLSADQVATLWDLSPRQDDRESKKPIFEGKWDYDQKSKLYSITLNEETTSYLLVSPPKESMCILIKGDLGAADLSASWFSSTPDEAPQDEERPDPY